MSKYKRHWLLLWRSATDSDLWVPIDIMTDDKCPNNSTEVWAETAYPGWSVISVQSDKPELIA
jgi:hypothetical protein